MPITNLSDIVRMPQRAPKTGRTKPKNVSKELVENVYRDERLTSREKAARLGIDPSTMYKYLRAYEIPTRTQGDGWEGERNPKWKGGRKKHGDYIVVYHPGHPRAYTKSYVPEHILVWEQVHNKPLPLGWVVHHLNGIKSDNRPQNLIALPSRKHTYVLAEKAKRIRELETENCQLRRTLQDGQMLFVFEN